MNFFNLNFFQDYFHSFHLVYYYCRVRVFVHSFDIKTISSKASLDVIKFSFKINPLFYFPKLANTVKIYKNGV